MVDKLVWASHKEPLKKYIFDFDGDAEYYAGKAKVKSAHNVWGHQLGIDSNFNIIHFGRLNASREKLHQKYGDSLRQLLDNERCACESCEAARRGVPSLGERARVPSRAGGSWLGSLTPDARGRTSVESF